MGFSPWQHSGDYIRGLPPLAKKERKGWKITFDNGHLRNCHAYLSLRLASRSLVRYQDTKQFAPAFSWGRWTLVPGCLLLWALITQQWMDVQELHEQISKVLRVCCGDCWMAESQYIFNRLTCISTSSTAVIFTQSKVNYWNAFRVQSRKSVNPSRETVSVSVFFIVLIGVECNCYNPTALGAYNTQSKATGDWQSRGYLSGFYTKHQWRPWYLKYYCQILSCGSDPSI